MHRPTYIAARLLQGLLVVSGAVPGCNPYPNPEDDFYAGPVDATDFPVDYRGTFAMACRYRSFGYSTAFWNGKTIAYYGFPYRPQDPQNPLTVRRARLASAYVFDRGPADPSPPSRRCTAPEGYQFDQARDAYPLDQQDNIFTRLPSAPDYSPLVVEVPVTSADRPCQAIKSERALLLASPLKPPSGQILAWPVLDPVTDVLDPRDSGMGTCPRFPPAAALGPQRMGWYGQYLLAYLDGGAVPIKSATSDSVELLAQPVLFPRRMPVLVDGKVTVVAGRPFAGFDVLSAPRGGQGYSPLCRLFSFEPDDPQKPPTRIADIRPATVVDEGALFFCLQLAAP